MNITKKLYLKYHHDQFVNIAKVMEYLGQTISSALPRLYALIPSDTTSKFLY